MAEWLGRRTSVREYPGSSPGRDVVSMDFTSNFLLGGSFRLNTWSGAPPLPSG